MSFEKTWYTLDEAAEKFGMEKSKILKWVEEGLVRAEESSGKVERVNVDDLDLKVQELTGI
jgi:excisionase family DNA binding protein